MKDLYSTNMYTHLVKKLAKLMLQKIYLNLMKKKIKLTKKAIHPNSPKSRNFNREVSINLFDHLKLYYIKSTMIPKK